MEHKLPKISFKSIDELHAWLAQNHSLSDGIFIRIYKKNSGIESVTFEDVLEEGLCFGWSESIRLKYDGQSYLQKFTPRRTIGTTSERNKRYATMLIQEGRMRPEGMKALKLENL